jgi:hypothetical protein
MGSDVKVDRVVVAPQIAATLSASWDLVIVCIERVLCSRPLGSHPGGPAATKRVSFSDPLVFSPSPLAPPRDGPGTVFLPGEEVFACQGPAAPSQVPQTRYPSHQRAPPQRLHLWPLLLLAEARARGEPCGHLPTPLAMVRPVGCTPITLYCTCI